MVAVFEDDVLPINKYTRRRADLKGSQLHLPGLIKAVISDFNYKKFFSTRTSGGKRAYSVVFALDISLSMDGHLAKCAMETLVLMVCTLLELQIESFSILLFGEYVRVIKRESQPWDAATICALLLNLRFDSDIGTLDGDAVQCAYQLLSEGDSRSPKKVFVITDGFSSSGQGLSQALQEADERGIEVVGMSVGIDRLNVRKCYQNWIHCALPCALPDAFRRRYGDIDPPEDPSEQAWETSRIAKSDAFESKAQIHQTLNAGWQAWDGLANKMKEQREMNLVSGSAPGACSVDIGFVVDCTGSMSPYMAIVKEQIKAIVDGPDSIIALIQKESSVEIELNVAFLGFRDVADGADQFKNEVTFTADIRGSFMKEVDTVQAYGGGDLVEDVVGALDRAANWNWKSRIRCLVLIGDSPGHTGELHTYKDKDDNFCSHPRNLNTQEVMHQLAAKDIGMFYCRINSAATAKMEQEFQKHFCDPSINQKGRELRCMDLVTIESGNPFQGALENHLVFAIDDSGSMSGSRWDDAVKAYNSALRQRREDLNRNGSQAGGDIVSVVQFSSHADIIFKAKPIQECPSYLNFRGGGTDFGPACQKAGDCLNHTPANATPILIFMSDGEGSGGIQGMENIKRSMARFTGFKCYTVAFGAGADQSNLKSMASVHGSRGFFRTAMSASDLIMVFQQAAGSGEAKEQLKTSVGVRISEQISQKLQLDWL
jgi:uncharacterized protein YegL